MARIDSAYDYFLTTYAPSIDSRYNSHKKSELRETYNNIIKTNKNSPLYKISHTQDLGKFAIDIKENANDIYNSYMNLTSNGNDISSVLQKRIAYSTNSNAVSPSFVGDEKAASDAFTIEIDSLATPQINVGNYLEPSQKSFEEGQYSFDLDIKHSSYEFQFNVNANDTNLSVQEKISRLINNSDIGLTSNIDTNSKGQTALVITSKATGLAPDDENIFSIQSGISWREINTLGISDITSPATNSSFSLNGVHHESMSNTFTVNKAYELSLRQPTDEPVVVSLMNDADALADGITSLLDSYNRMINTGLQYAQLHNNNTLKNDFSSVGQKMKDSLEICGISVDDSNNMTLDKDKLAQVINSSDKDTAFSTLNQLKDSIFSLAKKASINPMNYVDKTVVEYKNPNKTLTHPYAASQYSGLLVDYNL